MEGFEEKSLKIKPPQERISEEHEAALRLKTALGRAVELRLTSASGIAFSGGIDSTFLAALAKKINPAISLYAVGLPDSHDIIQAESAAEAIGMKDSLKVHLLSLKEIESAVPHVIYATESVDPMRIAIGLPLYFVGRNCTGRWKEGTFDRAGCRRTLRWVQKARGFFEQGS